MNTLQETQQEFLRYGCTSIPLEILRNGKEKTMHFPKKYADFTGAMSFTDERIWFTPNALAIRTGEPINDGHGVTAIDFDDDHDERFSKILAMGETRATKSFKGKHLLFRYIDVLEDGNKVFKGLPVDIANGSLINIPPSKGYSVLCDAPIASLTSEQLEYIQSQLKPKEVHHNAPVTLSKSDLLAKVKGDYKRDYENKNLSKEKVKAYNEQIKRLQTSIKRNVSSTITDEQIKRARLTPINKIIKVNAQGLAPCINPNHDDSHASMNCREAKGEPMTYCHVCHERNGSVDVYMKTRHCTFKEAVLELQ